MRFDKYVDAGILLGDRLPKGSQLTDQLLDNQLAGLQDRLVPKGRHRLLDAGLNLGDTLLGEPVTLQKLSYCLRPGALEMVQRGPLQQKLSGDGRVDAAEPGQDLREERLQLRGQPIHVASAVVNRIAARLHQELKSASLDGIGLKGP